MVVDVTLEAGDAGLFDRLVNGPQALVSGTTMRLVTRPGAVPKDPEVAISFPVQLPSGEWRTAVTVMTYSMFSAFANRLDVLYAEYPGKH